MNKDIFKVSVSQEFLQSAKVNVYVPYPDGGGRAVPFWTGMTYLLSGGTNGNSVLTGLTVPIMFEQSYKDIGYYSGFDGAIYQKDINNNFIYSAVTTSQYDLYLYNTSQNYSQDIVYTVDWGDNSPFQEIKNKAPEYTLHTYPVISGVVSKVYNVSLSGSGPWGTTITTKKITIPYTELNTPNEQGESFFVPMGTYWSGTPISYKWIFTGDSYNNIDAQVSTSYPQYKEVPFFVTGFTNSLLNKLRLYGPNPYVEGVPVVRQGKIIGLVNRITDTYTAYTYDNQLYYDYPEGYTLFITGYSDPKDPNKIVPITSGITQEIISLIPIAKEEILIGMVNATEIQSNVFIDRGKLSGTESLLRLGEIDSMNDLINYGYGYFKLTEI
jgi:hypothetical protein